MLQARDSDPLDHVPRVIHNEWFYAIARICVLAGTLIGIPFFSFLMSRIVNQADAMALQVAEQSVSLKILNATISEKQNYNFTTLTDHELRIRALEKSR